MEISFYKGDLETPAEVSVAPTAIRDAVTDTVSPESEGADEPVLTAPFVSPARNGRLPVPAGRSVWEIESTVPLRDAFPAEALLYAKGRILVQQKEAWELRDESGATLAQGARDPGAVFLDVENGRFYVNDPTGFLKAHDLETGAVQFLLYPLFGRGYVRSVLQARGDRIAFVGTELPVMSHRETRPPAYTIMELHDVAPPIQVDDEKVIRSNRLIESLVARPVPLIAVARGNGLALAAPDHLFFVNEDLRIEADLQESFTPITLSADDAGRVYVVVSTQSEDGPAVTSLWGIDGDGQRFLDAAVPAEATEIFMPPLIGYDGTVYLPLREEVLAFGAGGTLAWRTHAGAEIAGAVVTADHQILVTAGPRVLAMDEQGERRLVFQAEGDTLRTAPALVAPNRLYVASAGTLYRLKPMN